LLTANPLTAATLAVWALQRASVVPHIF
jgi:hypothetical protein